MMVALTVAIVLFFVLAVAIPCKLLEAEARDSGLGAVRAALFTAGLGMFSWLGWWAGRKWLQHRVSSRAAGPGVPDG